MKSYTELPNDAGSNIIGQVTAQMNRLQKRLASVKYTVAIMSGKGGVGKSALTANLATALTLKGSTVGVVDADINGPTLAKMMGVRNATLEYTPAGVKPAVTALGTKPDFYGFTLGRRRCPGPLECAYPEGCVHVA